MSKKATTKDGVNPKAGLDQLEEKKSQAAEGPQPKANKAGELPGQPITEENPSPLADQIHEEQLAKFKTAREADEAEQA